MGRLSVRDKLFLFTTLTGALFVSCQLQSATLDFHQLSSSGVFSTITSPSFQNQRGFFNVLRWAENLHTPQDLELVARMVQQSTLKDTSKTATASLDGGGQKDNSSFAAAGSNPPHPSSFHLQLTGIASFEVYVHLSKALLQCGLLLFLYRLKVLSRRHAMPTICLCVLVLLCWKMAQTCLLEILLASAASSKSHNSATRTQSTLPTTDHTLEMKAVFLNTLFLLRFAGTAVVNVVIGRAYQRYLCAPWPETWRRVPRYLGSKDLILATLFCASGCVAAMSVSCIALRPLSEAALQFESAALCCALFHFVIFRLSSPHIVKPKQV